jgi:hypothetical protein
MTNFATLKKSSNTLDRLTAEIEKINTKTERTADDRFWTPDVDKSGNGQAVIRFLPTPPVDGDDALPWARVFSHGFKGPTGKWYIENSLTTLNLTDPVSEYNTKLWNESSDDASPTRKQARAQKRRLNYYSNIMVISDPKHPENEGQVFLYRYGKKIFDKIRTATEPEFEGDPKFNPFDFWTGANFKLRIRQVEGYRNYDQSLFEDPKPLSEDDEELETIWNKEYSLKEFTEPKQFKSVEELQRRLNEVLALSATSAYAEARQDANEDEQEVVAWDGKVGGEVPGTDDVDNDLEYFKKLAAE